jgi:ribosome-associated toxin RatA of RatAB toxin-antitoxin module
MAEVRKNVLIEFTPAQMFELVDRCEDYPKFLPWCSGADVLERSEARTAARLHINYHGIKSHFATENAKRYPEHMAIRLVEGPFKHLEGEWSFRPLGNTACKIEFRLLYEFSSKLIEKAVGPVFHHIASTFVEAFVKRAEQIHGAKR